MPNTITDASELLAELRTTRNGGYSIGDVKNEHGVCCVAAPVRDHTGEVVAALSVSPPAYRLALGDLPEFGPTAVAVADKLSARIGDRRPVGAGAIA